MAIGLRRIKKIPHRCIIQGDGEYASIAAASVLAKTYRDEYMNDCMKNFRSITGKITKVMVQLHTATPLKSMVYANTIVKAFGYCRNSMSFLIKRSYIY